MSDSVSKLKELLFESEAATLSELSSRIAEVAAADARAAEQLTTRLRTLEATAQASGAALAAASGRLDSTRATLDATRAELASARAELHKRLGDVVDRIGTPEALRTSVAEVLDHAIVQARDTKHDELTRAVAPLVVRTIKTELRNNQDEMVEALYPITGQLVKAYVATAMRDLVRQMNRRLEHNAMMLRFRSLMSGYSRAELVLADTQKLEVEELYLIRRGSGALVQRWPQNQALSNSDIHMSGIIAAINDFAANAFQDEGGNLRAFDLDDFNVYLRASPVYLLAAKCRGTALTGVDTLIDDAFRDAIAANLDHTGSQHNGGTAVAPSSDADSVPQELLVSLRNRLDDGITQRHEEIAQAGLPFNPLKAVAGLLVLLLLAGAGWWGWTSYEASRTLSAARAVIDQTAAMNGFPVQLEVGYRGRTLSVSGLAPSAAARQSLLDELGSKLSQVSVSTPRLGVIPEPGIAPDLSPQITAVRRELSGLSTVVRTDIGALATTMQRDVSSLKTAVESNVANVRTTLRQDLGNLQTSMRRDFGALESDLTKAAVRRQLDRAERRLRQVEPDLSAIGSRNDTAHRRAADAATTTLQSVITTIAAEREKVLSASIDTLRRPAPDQPLASAAGRLDTVSDQLAGLLAGVGGTPRTRAAPPARAASEPIAAAEEIGIAAERLATTAAAVAQAGAIPIPAATPLPEPTPQQQFQAFAAVNAIFFADADAFRSPASAGRVLDELTGLMRTNALIVRIVGYTDERGGSSRNSEIAQLRAEKVAAELTRRGVPRQRLVLVGRATGSDLSSSTGAQSPNRRVEFELAFRDETAGAP